MQFIRIPHGDELAVLRRVEYERLTALAAEAEEDAGTCRLVTRARRALDERQEVAIPKAVANRIAAGENPILVVRDWRGTARVALADAAGISQSHVADLESGRRGGSPKQLPAVAAALKGPARSARILTRWAVGGALCGFIARFPWTEQSTYNCYG